MSEKAFLQNPLFDCAACQNYRRFLETGHNGLENCFSGERRTGVERRKGAGGVLSERKKVVELKDYTEIIW